MLHSLVTFFLLLYSVDALSSGAQIQISQAGINQAVQSLLQQVLITTDSFEIPEKRDGGIRLFDLVGSIKLDPKNAQVHLRNNGDIFVHIQNVQMEITGEGSYEKKVFKVRLLKTTVDLRVKTENTSLELTLGVINENGHPRILNKEARFNIGEMDIDVEGNILSKFIKTTLDAFKGSFKNRANDAVINVLNKKLQEFSDRIANIETEKEIGGYFRNHGLSVDYSLASNPSVANSAFIIPIVAQFWHNGHKSTTHSPSSPYPFGAPRQMACIDVDTKVIIESARHALHHSKFKVHKTFIVPVPDKFLNSTEMKVDILNADRHIHFNNSGAFLSMSGNGSTDVVVDGITTRSLDLDFAFTVHLMPNINIDNWSIKGTANIYKTKLSGNNEFINKLWETEIEPKIKKWIDNEFERSGIPLPKLDFITFCNARIEFEGPFVRFCSDIDFKFEKLFGRGSSTPSKICPAEQLFSANNDKEQRAVPATISEQEKRHDHEGIEDEDVVYGYMKEQVGSFASFESVSIIQTLTLLIIVCFNL